MSTFQERQKSLFDHLNEAEKQHNFSKSNVDNTGAYQAVIDRRTYRKVKSVMKQFQGKESIFKRPEAPISACLRVKKLPDHVKNPQKWVYYSLADVTPDQMSEETNTATALALLKQFEDQEVVTKEEVQEKCNESETVFKKPVFLSSALVKKRPKDLEKITFKSSKVIMPEYVVGVSNKVSKEVKPLKNNKNTVKKSDLKLDHLYDDNE